MTQNSNISVLPWYGSLDEQLHRLPYSYGETYPLFTPANSLLPFQIMRETRTNTAAEITAVLFTIDGEEVEDITTTLRETGIEIVKLADYDVIVYPARIYMATNWQDGRYYVRLNDGVQTWYSEVFTVVQSINSYIMLEWWNLENLVFDSGTIVYKEPLFHNRLYLCSEIGKPEYTFEEDGETRDGYFFPNKQLSEKTYKFTILAPEYLCDVLRLVRMSDYVRLRDQYGRVYNADTFLITPQWQTQGNLASVEVEYQTDTVVKKLGYGYTPQDTGDYNSDFNNDFNNQ